MNPLLQHLFGDATRLALSGDLGGASAAWQGAMARWPSWPGTPPASPSMAGFTANVDTASGLPQGGPRLFVPPTAEAGRPLPLIVMLHGCSQTPEDFAAGTGMNDVARAEGFFVLYPAQSADANPQACWNWFLPEHQRRDQGEPALIADLTQAVMRQHAIDPDRVFVAGLSAGGAMAAIVARAYPDLYAAVGVHSGLAVGAASDLKGALVAMKRGAVGMPLPSSGALSGPRLPTIVFHGDQDTTVHPSNGDEVVRTAIGPRSLVETESGQVDAGHAYTRQRHRDATSATNTEHWTVHGSGHAWSGGSASGSYTDGRGPDATREMVRFFNANRRRPISGRG